MKRSGTVAVSAGNTATANVLAGGDLATVTARSRVRAWARAMAPVAPAAAQGPVVEGTYETGDVELFDGIVNQNATDGIVTAGVTEADLIVDRIIDPGDQSLVFEAAAANTVAWAVEIIPVALLEDAVVR